MTRRMDHLVIACETLEAGAEWIGARLGQRLDPGGHHPVMGTHNRLLSLGPGEYLEVIAIDPDGQPPQGRKRWYGLDSFRGEPRIVAWCARDTHFVAPSGTSIVEMSRGDLRWQFTLPDDDLVPGNGTQPLFINWKNNAHPCDRLPDRGFRLLRFEMTTPEPQPLPRVPDPRIRLGFGHTRLRALIRRPDGTELWL